ncbi:MAG: hypothetical protein D6767_06875, partial [Candidatus Hydrogenedentota bacterium]
EFIRFSDSETSKAPQKSMSKARLSVRCFSGQSVWIAGFRTVTRVEDVVGIPLLKEIPFINFLFASTVSIYRQKEVAIILTPILEPPETSRVPNRYQQIRYNAE